MLKKADDFHSALLLYRNTPPQGNTYSPAQCMFLWHTKTILPTSDHHLAPVMINFSVVEKDFLKQRHDSKEYYDKSAGAEHNPVKIGIRQTTTPSSGQTLDLWASDKERTRKVLHDSYLSWHHDPREQGPTETCRSSTTFNPTSDSSHVSLNG